jgi:hypothetical protein
VTVVGLSQPARVLGPAGSPVLLAETVARLAVLRGELCREARAAAERAEAGRQ